MPLPLHTRRLTLRPVTASDAADVLAVFAAPDVMRYWNSEPPAGLEEAGEWAEHLAGQQRRLGYAQWRVSERASGRLVGFAGLQRLQDGPEVELTYALLPSCRGVGYATEAGAAALHYGFDEAGLERVVGIVREQNTASVRVLRRLGMRALGAAEYWGSSWAKYELTAAEWRDEQAAGTPPLRTGHLELRRFAAADLGPLLGVFGDPQVMKYVGVTRRPLDAAELAGSQLRVDQHWARHGFGPLAVVERASGRLVGEAGLQLLEDGPDVELTYTLARAAWGRGYATEAASAVLLWGFAGLRLPRIVAVAYADNAASLRVLKKSGMTRLGTRRCYGAVLDEFSIGLGEWRAGVGRAAGSAAR
jgi:ribosomal-protein-alanine N-acetyltransferase